MIRKYLSLVKFSHTVFALPFALLGFSFAFFTGHSDGAVSSLLLVLACMVTARNAAMAFNRLIDASIDRRNERTAGREIPSGIIGKNEAVAFILINVIAFITCTAFLNPLCFALSPVALLVILGYSYTKRFTWLCHLFLGLGLGLAPVGAYAALSGNFNTVIILYGVAVATWVAGFDIIYALQDEEIDKEEKLKSIPAHFGRKTALLISNLFHFICGTVLLIAAYVLYNSYPGAHLYHWLGVSVFIVFLFYQHSLISEDDISKVNAAFFTSNGISSIIFGCLGILDYYLYF